MTVNVQDVDCQFREEYKFKSINEIKLASNRFFDQANDPSAKDILNDYRNFRINCIKSSFGLLCQLDFPQRVLVSARLKRMKSIHRKLIRTKGKIPVNKMYDLIGFRIICETLNEVLELGSQLEEKLNARINDYISNVHFNKTGYRSIHGIVSFPQPFHDSTVPVRFEVQIRTWYQHLWGCWSESFGERAKEGSTKNLDLLDKFRHQSEKIKNWEVENPSSIQQLLPDFSDSYNFAIAWLTPSGDYGIETIEDGLSEFFDRLLYLESKKHYTPLLLAGVSDSSNLKKVLQKTHPKYLTNRSLEPKIWMPE